MKKVVAFTALVLTVFLLGAAPSARAVVAPTFTLLNELPTHLAIGESYTVEVLVTSDEPFIYAGVMLNKYYPGRGIWFDGPDHVGWGTSAVLHMTITGKNSTMGLSPVTDWPETEDWPGDVAPLVLVVGCRYPGGRLFSRQFPFAVAVP